MDFKFLTTLLSGGFLLASAIGESGATFKYLYQIKANSYSPKDSLAIYYYKEKLIDKYEEIAFSLKEEYLSEALRTNISQFRFDDQCVPSYHNGVLVLTLGEGKGGLVEGRLRYNSCDNGVIREKVFIFDIFK